MLHCIERTLCLLIKLRICFFYSLLKCFISLVCLCVLYLFWVFPTVIGITNVVNVWNRPSPEKHKCGTKKAFFVPNTYEKSAKTAFSLCLRIVISFIRLILLFFFCFSFWIFALCASPIKFEVWLYGNHFDVILFIEAKQVIS